MPCDVYRSPTKLWEDPCIYIQRFAHKLEFGDKTHEVSMAALRLVSRMKRDWMAQGRRPSGLCGAALLVAARIHDFNRTIKDIVRVVQIGEGTIRKRLAEFEATPSSELTIDEFQKIDLEEEMDPPCFTEGRRKAKLQQLEEQGQLPSLTLEIVELQDEIEKTLDEIIAKKAKRFSGRYGTDTSSVCSSAPSLSELDSELAQLEQDQATKFITEETVSTVLDIASKRSHEDGENRTLESDDETDSVKQSNEVNDKDTLLMPPPTFPIGRPTAASLGLRESIEEHMKIRKPDEPEEEVDESGELDLTGIDDEELDLYILTEREAKLKTKIWMEINADYLKEMKEKEEREAKLKEEQKDKPEKKRKKPRKKQQTKEASTAREAIEKMLQEKKISSKINYDVLRSLTSDLKKVETTTTSSPTLGSGSIEALPTTLPTTPQKRFRRLSSSQGPTMKSESKSERKIDLSEPAEKKSRLEPNIREEVVVVESGPIEYAAEEADDIDEEEEEEEEEEHVSAAQLMGHNTAEDDYDGGDMGYEDYD